jgi:hypothetical protein
MGDRSVEGQRMVVGSQDQRLDNDVGSLQRIPSFPHICQQRQNVGNDSISWYNMFCFFDIYLSAHIYCSRNTFGGAAMKPKNYDYYLIIITTLILFGIGAVSLYGITYYNYLAVNADWTKTLQYNQYIDEMNSYIYPFLVLLLISLGLCIPKRLFEQDTMIKSSALILGITIIITIFSGLETGLGFILVVMTSVQAIVLILTIKKSRTIRFEKEGYVVRLGSSLLHLGVVILIFNFVNFQDSPYHLLIFWFGMVLITSGNIFSFYPEKLSSLFPHE